MTSKTTNNSGKHKNNSFFHEENLETFDNFTTHAYVGD